MASVVGQDRGRRPRSDTVEEVSSATLLGRGRGPGADGLGEFPVAWLADLHDPRLVISPAYLGPDRRRAPRPVVAHPDRRIVQAVAVAILTALAVVPLTVMATSSGPSVSGGSTHPTASVGAARVAASGAGPARGRASRSASVGTGARGTIRTRGAAATGARTSTDGRSRQARRALQTATRAQARQARQVARASARQVRQAARASARAARRAARTDARGGVS